MRNISFSLTTEQIKNRTKTVTRRLGWKNLKAGDRLQACVKCMGLKPGEKIEKLAEIEVVKVSEELLMDMQDADCHKEGFPNWNAKQFVTMFCEHMHVFPHQIVTRIEFKYLPK